MYQSSFNVENVKNGRKRNRELVNGNVVTTEEKTKMRSIIGMNPKITEHK